MTYVPPFSITKTIKCVNCREQALFTGHPVLKELYLPDRRALRSRDPYERFEAEQAEEKDLCFFYKPDEVCVWRCPACGSFGFEVGGKLVWPEAPAVEPSEYLKGDALEAFLEAQSVLRRSPRCACAMLRLSLERLAVMCGAPDVPLSKKLDALGLSPRMKKLATACRLVGNDAVHEGRLDYRADDSEVLAESLSRFINRLAEDLIGNELEAEKMIQAAKKR